MTNFKALFTESIKYTGGPDDYTTKSKIDKLLNMYDMHVDRIDDYQKVKKVRAQNNKIKKQLKELGVETFTINNITAEL